MFRRDPVIPSIADAKVPHQALYRIEPQRALTASLSFAQWILVRGITPSLSEALDKPFATLEVVSKVSEG